MLCRRCLIALFLLPPCAVGAVEPVYTTDLHFRIPYNSDPAELARLGARQVRLYVSQDQGVHWTTASSVDPTAGEFTFQAPHDGEYWFAVRTVDRAGRLYPPASAGLSAGLKVIVDSQRPTLRLTLQRVGDRLQLNWQARDPQLAADTLQLALRQGAAQAWKPLEVTKAAQGQTSWSAPSSGQVVVRGSIADLAGNQATARKVLGTLRTGYPPLPKRPDLEGPIAQVNSETLAEQPVRRQEPQIIPVSQREPVEAPFVAAEVLSESPSKPARPAKKPPTKTSTASESTSSKSTAKNSTTEESLSKKPAQRDSANPETAAGKPPSAPPSEGATSRPEETSRAPVAGSDEDEDAQLIGTKNFVLGYHIDEVGPSGVGAVTFYITEDGGRTWYRYGTDPDRHSPFEIQVPRAGSYGFTVRVRSGVGLGPGPPRPGEEPAFRVVVDETPPQVTVAPPTQHMGESGPVVRIKWTSTDSHPAQGKSVAIDYASSPNGPWKTIAKKIENTGHYDWHAQDLPGGRLFIRVRARDAAGNVGSGLTSEPVIVDFVRPQARITNVKVRPAE